MIYRRMNFIIETRFLEKGIKKGGRMTAFCVPSGTRTLDPLIKSQLLYQLS